MHQPAQPELREEIEEERKESAQHPSKDESLPGVQSSQCRGSVVTERSL